jgi:hypothetical protein
MSGITKFLAAATTASLVATGAMAGGLGGAAVESEPIVEETQPVSSLGIAGPLVLLLLIGAAASGGSSNGTTATAAN